jgi:hypothetical protein
MQLYFTAVINYSTGMLTWRHEKSEREGGDERERDDEKVVSQSPNYAARD